MFPRKTAAGSMPVDGFTHGSIEYYRRAANWPNRLILGDSLNVMGSFAERENLRGQVQMTYVDLPESIDHAHGVAKVVQAMGHEGVRRRDGPGVVPLSGST
jgi:hypothetical protein